jgi:hypothetical protein
MIGRFLLLGFFCITFPVFFFMDDTFWHLYRNEAMQSLSQASILVSGMSGLGCEIGLLLSYFMSFDNSIRVVQPKILSFQVFEVSRFTTLSRLLSLILRRMFYLFLFFAFHYISVTSSRRWISVLSARRRCGTQDQQSRCLPSKVDRIKRIRTH